MEEKRQNLVLSDSRNSIFIKLLDVNVLVVALGVVMHRSLTTLYCVDFTLPISVTVLNFPPPTLRTSSDTICLEMAPSPTGSGLSPTRLQPPTSDASCKFVTCASD